MMDRSVLGDIEIETMLKKDFIYVRIDIDKTTDIARLYGIRGYPSSWFLESSGARIVEVPGYVQKSLFKKVLQYVKGGYYRTSDVNEYLKKH
jgi:thioredoxin-related protein